jgi:hypothetical protein
VDRHRHLKTVSADEKARRYERLFPGALTDDAQKAERMERLDLKQRRKEGRASRFVMVPEMPWHRKESQ